MGPEQYPSPRGLAGSVMTPSMTSVHMRLPGLTSSGSVDVPVIRSGKPKM